ncbi:Protein kinase-like domain [Pseudocohnilembus persalinus]|uniref:Protein kinase-like domain n=1 Tax=Pseudocohnilembus persalinus TaxID=266149 RepID=A0A0V0QV17_PSEPJ|nr:Protein kinase-like domain [Pseudocohnilembus persalinus]|eukprot:KRX05824.1 Protein kinase-like domain [Pseudocohnilembus persalinus]
MKINEKASIFQEKDQNQEQKLNHTNFEQSNQQLQDLTSSKNENNNITNSSDKNNKIYNETKSKLQEDQIPFPSEPKINGQRKSPNFPLLDSPQFLNFSLNQQSQQKFVGLSSQNQQQKEQLYQDQIQEEQKANNLDFLSDSEFFQIPSLNSINLSEESTNKKQNNHKKNVVDIQSDIQKNYNDYEMKSQDQVGNEIEGSQSIQRNQDKKRTISMPNIQLKKSGFHGFTSSNNEENSKENSPNYANYSVNQDLDRTRKAVQQQQMDCEESFMSDFSTYQNKSQYIVEFKDPNKRVNNIKETNEISKNYDTESGFKILNDYIIIKELGRGAMGKVKLAKKKVENPKPGEMLYFAIKQTKRTRIKKYLMAKGEDGMSYLEREIAIMKKLEHPNVTRLYEVIDDQEKKKMYLVMHYAEKGSLMSKIYWNKTLKEENPELWQKVFKPNGHYRDRSLCPTRISQKKALKYFRDLALALDYLHNFCQVVHRDIKPENLLIDGNDRVQIGDFGVSQLMDSKKSENNQNAGTLAFMPPETFKSAKYQAKPTDIWAAGCTLYYMVVGRIPFQSNFPGEIRERICKDELVFPQELNLDPNLIDCIKRCMDKNSATRIVIRELLTHPWLTQNGEFILRNNVVGQFAIDEDDIKKSIVNKSVNKIYSSLLIYTRLKQKLQQARQSLKQQQESDQQSGQDDDNNNQK